MHVPDPPWAVRVAAAKTAVWAVGAAAAEIASKNDADRDTAYDDGWSIYMAHLADAVREQWPDPPALDCSECEAALTARANFCGMCGKPVSEG